jgi:hypothetical protein
MRRLFHEPRMSRIDWVHNAVDWVFYRALRTHDAFTRHYLSLTPGNGEWVQRTSYPYGWYFHCFTCGTDHDEAWIIPPSCCLAAAIRWREQHVPSR